MRLTAILAIILVLLASFELGIVEALARIPCDDALPGHEVAMIATTPASGGATTLPRRAVARTVHCRTLAPMVTAIVMPGPALDRRDELVRHAARANGERRTGLATTPPPGPPRT